MKNVKFILKENRLANVIRFSIETIQAMEFFFENIISVVRL